MRSRIIKPGFWKNEELGDLPIPARLLFIGLWCLADQKGIIKDRPRQIMIELFPFDKRMKDDDVNTLLDMLLHAGFIARYSAEGLDLIQVVNFKNHQHIHPHEAKSTLPDAPCNYITGNDKECKPTSSSTSISTSTSTSDSPHNPPLGGGAFDAARFDSFWKAYPRKVAKGAALKAWRKINPTEKMTTAMIEAIDIQRKSDQWQKDGGQFIPHAATWLNQRRWDDEPDNFTTQTPNGHFDDDGN